MYLRSGGGGLAALISDGRHVFFPNFNQVHLSLFSQVFDLYLLGFCLCRLWLVEQTLQHGFLGLVNMFHPKFAGPAAS